MKKLESILVFGNDKNLLVLLQGYCFAKNITITTQDFTVSALRQIAKINPCLAVIPINLVHGIKNTDEIEFLRQELTSHENLKTCILKDGANAPVPKEFTAWVDAVIQSPLDLEEFDSYLNSAFPESTDLSERRHGERRCCQERRGFEYNGAIPKNTSLVKAQPENEGLKNPGCLGFRLDRRKRCLLINDSKTDLTPKEFELIELLLTDVNRIFMVDEIVKHLWPKNHRATKSDLYQYMHLLRKKVEKDPTHPKWLMNVKGYGYKLNIN